MLDSGASCYYNFELGNFEWLDYLSKDKRVPAATANNITYIKAIETIKIYYVNNKGQQHSTIINNVNYIPSITV